MYLKVDNRVDCGVKIRLLVEITALFAKKIFYECSQISNVGAGFARPDTSTDISVDAFGQANPAPTSAFASLRLIDRMYKLMSYAVIFCVILFEIPKKRTKFAC